MGQLADLSEAFLNALGTILIFLPDGFWRSSHNYFKGAAQPHRTFSVWSPDVKRDPFRSTFLSCLHSARTNSTNAARTKRSKKNEKNLQIDKNIESDKIVGSDKHKNCGLHKGHNVQNKNKDKT